MVPTLARCLVALGTAILNVQHADGISVISQAPPHGSGHTGHTSALHAAEAEAYGLCLLGSVAVVMSIFYLVNWPDEDIVAHTWQTLSMTVSIFGSVLIYGTVVVVTLELLNVHTQWATTMVLLGLFSACFLAFQAVLLVQMRSCADDSDSEKVSPRFGPMLTTVVGRMPSLRATSTICSHVTGFAGMYCVAGLQALPPFDTSLAASAGLVAFVAVILTGLCAAGAHLRRQIALADDGEISRAEELWMLMVEDAENDVYSLCIGFSIMQAIRFAITGAPQPYHAEDEPRAVSQQEAHGLLIASLILCTTTAAGTKLMKYFHDWHIRWRRALRALLNICSVAMAWCILFWGEWQIYVMGFDGVRVAGLLLVALCLTALSCLLIVILDFIADAQAGDEARVLRTLILSLGLMVGFTWERSFHMGLNALSHGHGAGGGAFRHVLAISLAAVVLPAWAKYILPHAISARDHNVCRVISTQSAAPADGSRALIAIGAQRC